MPQAKPPRGAPSPPIAAKRPEERRAVALAHRPGT